MDPSIPDPPANETDARIGIWTLRDRGILRAEFFTNRAQGLASVGLAE